MLGQNLDGRPCLYPLPPFIRQKQVEGGRFGIEDRFGIMFFEPFGFGYYFFQLLLWDGRKERFIEVEIYECHCPKLGNFGQKSRTHFGQFFLSFTS
jgi:hypothetical protein